MKRKDQIILISQRLFNEVGEANLAAIDIANELDISPGNLYYHFKGKAEIMAELLRRFSAQLDELFGSELEGDDLLLDFWLKVSVFLELLYDYRFFFRNINDIGLKYRETGAKLAKLLGRLDNILKAGFTFLARRGFLSIDPAQDEKIESLVKSVGIVSLYWANFQEALGARQGKAEHVVQALGHIQFLIEPFMDDANLEKLHLFHQAYLDNAAVED